VGIGEKGDCTRQGFYLNETLFQLTKHKYSFLGTVKKFGTVKSVIHACSPLNMKSIDKIDF